MNKKYPKLPAIVSYLTWVGWIVAMLLRDKEDRFTTRHINQSLAINLLETLGTWLAARKFLGGVPGEVIDLVVLILWIMGIVRAGKGSDAPLPVVGRVNIVP